MAAGLLSALTLAMGGQAAAQVDPTEVIQRALINESFGYINLSQRGGRPTGPAVDNDGPPPLQQASMEAEFSNFSLNGIPLSDWQECRLDNMQSVDECLQQLVEDRDGDGVKGLRELHPGEIGGDTFAFDLTITNASPPGVVLTSFAFQSKISESPALGSRIGDKLFKTVSGGLTSSAANPGETVVTYGVQLHVEDPGECESGCGVPPEWAGRNP